MSSLALLWSDPTRQTCTIDFNFNFVQNSTQSFILNCMIEFLDWGRCSFSHFSSFTAHKRRWGSIFKFSFVLYLIFNINIYSWGFNSKTAQHHHRSEMKNNKIVNRSSMEYLNEILNIQILTSNLYRKWYYMESWIINLTLNYNQVNHYLKLCNEPKLFQ